MAEGPQEGYRLLDAEAGAPPRPEAAPRRPWRRGAAAVGAGALLGLLAASASLPRRPTPAALAAGAGEAGLTGQFLHISDIHFDPWYDPSVGKACFCNRPEYQQRWCAGRAACGGCEGGGTGNVFGQQGCDTPVRLARAALEAAAASAPPGGYDWVLVTGDYSRHHVDRLSVNSTKELVRSIIREVAEMVQQYFPRTKVHHNLGHALFALGNDDFVMDYDNGREVSDAEWFASLQEFLLPPVNAMAAVRPGAARGGDVALAGAAAPRPEHEHHRTFPGGGYFFERLTDQLFLVSLNTVVYSAEHEWSGRSPPKDPFGQFRWFEEALQWVQAQHDDGRPAKVLIVGHIPPTLNNFDFKPQWLDSYVVSYHDIVERYAHLVAGQAFGHLHSDTFRLPPPSARLQQPIFVSGGVSPVFENNPTFRVWKHRGGELLDFTVHRARLNHSGPQEALAFLESYSALGGFGLESLAAPEWREKVAERLLGDDAVWRRYIGALWAREGALHEGKAASEAFRLRSACGVRHMRMNDFEACVAGRAA